MNHLISEELHRQLVEALEIASTGLAWYRDLCPDAVDGSDDEADTLIARALAALQSSPQEPEALQRAAGEAAVPILASFAHEVLMGAIRPDELRFAARLALRRAGLEKLDDVVRSGEAAPLTTTEMARSGS